VRSCGTETELTSTSDTGRNERDQEGECA
jgi:hypothetical protein